MAEVHIIGQLVGARDFPKQSLFCKWTLQCGNNWKILSGKYEGQTQVVCPEFDNVCRWSFPIDIHLVSTGIPGWPKIYIQVYYLDWFNRTHLFGYGFLSIPTSPGNHVLNCYTWRPFGTIRERFIQFFLGGGPRINSTEVTSAVGVTFGSDGCDFIDVKCEEYNTSTDKNETENNYTVATTAVSMLLNISNENEIENNYAVVTTAIPLLLNISKETSSTTLRNEICTCDLQISICDINCCCDEDCTNEKRLVFDHCEMEPSPIYDTRYCKHLTLSYKNNTPYEWQVNYNNLFCIVKNNLPDEYSSHKEVEIFSDNDANFRKVNKHRWNSIHPMKKLLYTGNKSYFRYGDFVWIVQNRRLKVLEIPKNFEGTGVVITKKAKYLQNIKTTCIQTNLFAHNKLLDISTFIVNVTVVALPNSINIHRLEECPSNICIPVQARVCDDALEHCRNITKPFNTSIYRADCNFKEGSSTPLAFECSIDRMQNEALAHQFCPPRSL
ncbi:hypothetical protein Trydic_g16188 [Trypoxylus dichotomus]